MSPTRAAKGSEGSATSRRRRSAALAPAPSAVEVGQLPLRHLYGELAQIEEVVENGRTPDQLGGVNVDAWAMRFTTSVFATYVESPAVPLVWIVRVPATP